MDGWIGVLYYLLIGAAVMALVVKKEWVHKVATSMAVALAEQMDRRLPQLEELRVRTEYYGKVLSEMKKHQFRCPNVRVNRKNDYYVA